MKAIIKVNKFSSYAHYNGHTFDVAELMEKTIALSIHGTVTDFGLSEVIIVDLQEHYEFARNIEIKHPKSSDCFIFGLAASAAKSVIAIEYYCRVNKIQLQPVTLKKLIKNNYK